MQTSNSFPILCIILALFIASCATQRQSVIEGGEYDANKNETNYFVLPFGSVVIPDKWTKTSFGASSNQQFFINKDSIEIAIAFNQYNKIEFNQNGYYKGFEFVKAYYDWESKYFIERFGFQSQVLESDSINKYMIWRLFGLRNNIQMDTYFLIGEKNGNASNFSISITDKWTEQEKIKFLKTLFLDKKLN